eukprot:15463475-Alexandrium_andersonii.AAC.1
MSSAGSRDDLDWKPPVAEDRTGRAEARDAKRAAETDELDPAHGSRSFSPAAHLPFGQKVAARGAP